MPLSADRRTDAAGALRAVALAAAMAALAGGAPAAAQSNAVPNALQGFATNRNQPVQIEAQTLEVRDKDKVATFSGDVRVTQGDTVIRSKSLVVFYQDSGAGGARAATPGPAGQTQISRLEARGGVVVTQKDQTATGDLGLFDVRSNTVTLTGNVVVSQGSNVMRGDRLVVDLTSGVSRVESGKRHGPVRMLIQQQPGGGQRGPSQGLPSIPRPLPRPN